MSITWNQSLETGIPLIDFQHKELVKQVNTLFDPGNMNRFQETLDFLEKYVVKHFSDEQKMQTDSRYPKAAAHKSYHDAFVVTFKKLKSDYEKKGGTASNNIELTRTAADWLKNHILVHDKDFAEYYKTQK